MPKIFLQEPLLCRNASIWKCCSGYCVDLLNKLATDVGFSYELYKVEDGHWGIKGEVRNFYTVFQKLIIAK